MNIQIHFTHIEATDALKNTIKKKAQKLEKFFHRHFEITWTCSVEKNEHSSHVIVSGDGFTLNASSAQDHLYKTFDEVISKLEKQIARKRGNRNGHLHNQIPLSELTREEV